MKGEAYYPEEGAEEAKHQEGLEGNLDFFGQNNPSYNTEELGSSTEDKVVILFINVRTSTIQI